MSFGPVDDEGCSVGEGNSVVALISGGAGGDPLHKLVHVRILPFLAASFENGCYWHNRLEAGVKGGRRAFCRPAQRTLDAGFKPIRCSKAGCGIQPWRPQRDHAQQLFEAALGISSPWYVQGVNFDAAKKTLTIRIDFVAGSRFAHPAATGLHLVHDTQDKRYRHLNFFQHECYLEVRQPRVKLPEGRGALVEPDWAGKLSGFTLLFEALVLALAQQMPFAAVARTVGESWHRVHAICARYVELAVAEADLSEVTALAIDETSYRRGHNYLSIAAHAHERKVVFVTEGRDAETIERLAEHLTEHQATPEQVSSVSIDMWPAFIKGITEHLPNARITFDKFHVVAHASTAVDKTRRLEQKTDPNLKGLRWALLKDRDRLPVAQRADLDALIARATTKRTARA